MPGARHKLLRSTGSREQIPVWCVCHSIVEPHDGDANSPQIRSGLAQGVLKPRFANEDERHRQVVGKPIAMLIQGRECLVGCGIPGHVFKERRAEQVYPDGTGGGKAPVLKEFAGQFGKVARAGWAHYGQFAVGRQQVQTQHALAKVGPPLGREQKDEESKAPVEIQMSEERAPLRSRRRTKELGQITTQVSCGVAQWAREAPVGWRWRFMMVAASSRTSGWASYQSSPLEK